MAAGTGVAAWLKRILFGAPGGNSRPIPVGTYTDWRWPDEPGGYTRFEWTVTPETDPTPVGYFWSHQFAFIGGAAGYCGMQTLGSEPTGKIAIFSIWDALGGESEEFSQPFGSEGQGWTVRTRLRWEVGGTYRFGVTEIGAGRWEATVVGPDGIVHPIGYIAVPHGWGRLADRSVMWTERYSGPMRRCEDLGHAAARFSVPTAQAEDRGVVAVGRRHHLAQNPGCPGSRAEDLEDPATGIRHVMGAPASPQNSAA